MKYGSCWRLEHWDIRCCRWHSYPGGQEWCLLRINVVAYRFRLAAPNAERREVMMMIEICIVSTHIGFIHVVVFRVRSDETMLRTSHRTAVTPSPSRILFASGTAMFVRTDFASNIRLSAHAAVRILNAVHDNDFSTK